MIHSMTGFGDAADERDGSRYLVEIKSLNNRYFKPTIKLPDAVSGLEPEIESALRKRTGRGSVIYALRMKSAEPAAGARIDVEALRAYVGQLAQAGFEVREPERLMFLPGVIVAPTAADAESADDSALDRHREIVLRLTREAADKLLAMRRREGESLMEDLAIHLGVISEHLGAIRDRAGGVVEQYHERLLARVNELLAKAELSVVQGDLLKEVAVFAERSDISEELHRLGHHVEQFGAACRGDAEEYVGRKLDFITQEMLREANTIGSKAGDPEIAGRIVDIKGAIDRLKEQVQNVE